MKKLITLIAGLILIFALASCSNHIVSEVGSTQTHTIKTARWAGIISGDTIANTRNNILYVVQ